MTTAQLLLAAHDTESHSTRRILACVPEHLSTWQPHPKSMPLVELALHLATLPGSAILCLTTTSFDLLATPPTQPTSAPSNLLATWDHLQSAARHYLATATEAHLAELWTLRRGDQVLTTTTRAFALQHNYLGHLIHHRAQLGMYLRLNNLPVPGVYGPSADEKLSPGASS